MKKSFINEAVIEGILYEHSLEKRVTGPTSKNPNTPYISGSISIATDDEMTNVVQVNYTYVTEKTSTGKVNSIYDNLDKMISGNLVSYVKAAPGESAARIRVNSRVALREFYRDTGELVSTKINDGGFITVITNSAAYNPRATYKVDILITSVVRHEENEERQTPERVIVKGAIFDSYRKALLPCELTALHPNAMNYFEGLGASQKEPVFTKVWGKEVSQTVVTQKVEESAFGDARVENYSSTRKDFVIEGAQNIPYEWDDESSLLASELKAMIQERETYLATLKQRQEDYKKNSAAKKTAPASAIAKDDNYDF